jgi:hypothetical protein
MSQKKADRPAGRRWRDRPKKGARAHPTAEPATKPEEDATQRGRYARHGFYSDQFTVDELALIAAFVSDLTLDDEIWMQRVLNRRLLAYVAPGRETGGESDDSAGEALDVATLVKVAQALAIGTGRVARLLRDKRALSGKAADGMAGAFALALQEVCTELGIAL